jgi:hypothetical protein
MILLLNYIFLEGNNSAKTWFRYFLYSYLSVMAILFCHYKQVDNEYEKRATHSEHHSLIDATKIDIGQTASFDSNIADSQNISDRPDFGFNTKQQ